MRTSWTWPDDPRPHATAAASEAAAWAAGHKGPVGGRGVEPAGTDPNPAGGLMYGANGAQLRTAMTGLLRQHRIQQRLGGAGLHSSPATTTAAERAELGDQIGRYRHGVLTWCSEATQAVQPVAFSNVPTPAANPFRTTPHRHVALAELQRSLDHARISSASTLPRLEELTRPHPNAVVEAWRQAARAAALAEHDLAGPEQWGRLSAMQAQALIGDVAAITQALVILDRRYRRVPGWEQLAGVDRLGWAALACALDVALGHPDYSLDQTGWRPRIKTIRGPGKPGLPGVLQAEHNLLVRLNTFPSLTHLRLVADAQRLLSADLADRARPFDATRAANWSRRAETYTLLHGRLGELRGRIGKGSLAVAEAANAVSRLAAIPRTTTLEPRVLAGFEALFGRVDDRIADLLQEGITRGAYLQPVPLPRLQVDAGGLTQPVRERVTPLTGTPRLDLTRLVDTRLRTTTTSTPEQRPHRSRVELAAALLHRPTIEGTDAAG